MDPFYIETSIIKNKAVIITAEEFYDRYIKKQIEHMQLYKTYIHFTIPLSSLFKFYPNEVFKLYDMIKDKLMKMDLSDVETRLNYIENQTTNYLKHFCDVKEYTDEEFNILYEKYKHGVVEDPFMFITDDAIIDDYKQCANEIKVNMDSGRYISTDEDIAFKNKCIEYLREKKIKYEKIIKLIDEKMIADEFFESHDVKSYLTSRSNVAYIIRQFANHLAYEVKDVFSDNKEKVFIDIRKEADRFIELIKSVSGIDVSELLSDY